MAGHENTGGLGDPSARDPLGICGSLHHMSVDFREFCLSHDIYGALEKRFDKLMSVEGATM